MTIPKIFPGLRVKTILGEQDTDDHGAERFTPAGTWGHVSEHNHADHWNVEFLNDAAVILTEAELMDPSQYKLADPNTLEQNALALQYGQDHLELTILDDWMMPFTQEIAGNPNQILDLIKELNTLDELDEVDLAVIASHRRSENGKTTSN